jgi:shikimate dehydrogenase
LTINLFFYRICLDIGAFMEIKGTTKITGLFGYPVHHTFSPAMHNAAFEALDLDFVYLPFEVRPENLKEAVQSLISLGITGVNVTIPHKEKVIPFLDELSKEAELIGSVNTIQVRDRKLRGYNTDAYGFETSLKKELGVDLKSRKIFVMGAGGASRAVCFQSALSGAHEIVIADLEGERARALCDAVARNFPRSKVTVCPVEETRIKEALSGKDIFVNATPVGMKPDDPPVIQIHWLSSGTMVFDAIYNPEETRLLLDAREKGHKTMNGIGMLLYQGARAFEIFTGEKAPVEIMLEVLTRRFRK